MTIGLKRVATVVILLLGIALVSYSAFDAATPAPGSHGLPPLMPSGYREAQFMWLMLGIDISARELARLQFASGSVLIALSLLLLNRRHSP